MLEDSDHALLNRWGFQTIAHNHFFKYFDNIKRPMTPLFSTIIVNPRAVYGARAIRLAHQCCGTAEHMPLMANVDKGIRMFFDGLWSVWTTNPL